MGCWEVSIVPFAQVYISFHDKRLLQTIKQPLTIGQGRRNSIPLDLLAVQSRRRIVSVHISKNPPPYWQQSTSETPSFSLFQSIPSYPVQVSYCICPDSQQSTFISPMRRVSVSRILFVAHLLKLDLSVIALYWCMIRGSALCCQKET